MAAQLQRLDTVSVRVRVGDGLRVGVGVGVRVRVRVRVRVLGCSSLPRSFIDASSSRTHSW